MTTAENYFDEIYTMHLNEFVRMPKTELYDLMTNFAKQYHKEQLTLTDVVKPFYCHSEESGGFRCGEQCLGCDGIERDERQ